MGTLVEQSPLLINIASAGGALFLFIYGLKSFRSALLSGGVMDAGSQPEISRSKIITATLAITLLNPHVYLDTVVLLGSMSGTFPGNQRYLFGLGAVTASFLWFFTLSLGAGQLAPLFRKRYTWRILDLLIGIVMWTIAFRLTAPLLKPLFFPL